MPIKNNELFDSLSLDAVAESILDKMHEHTPSFLMESEKNTERQLEEYTRRIARQYLPKNKYEKYESIVEPAGCKRA